MKDKRSDLPLSFILYPSSFFPVDYFPAAASVHAPSFAAARMAEFPHAKRCPAMRSSPFNVQ
jgi:hypothetical protein